MIKVGFLKELKPGDLIVVPGGGRGAYALQRGDARAVCRGD